MENAVRTTYRVLKESADAPGTRKDSSGALSGMTALGMTKPASETSRSVVLRGSIPRGARRARITLDQWVGTEIEGDGLPITS